ncbi:hypothetical protein CsSME_00000285 [Camellia sinensis var. sinensis]
MGSDLSKRCCEPVNRQDNWLVVFPIFRPINLYCISPISG